jgi:hypothetical protein
MCLKESAGWKKEEGLLLASDSTGIKTDRYGYEVRPVKKNKKFELMSKTVPEMAYNSCT